MRGAAALGAALALLALAGAVRAQEGTPGVSAQDRAAVATCLRDAADLPRACIGAVAVVCARPGAGAATGGANEVACSRREAAIWRERLDVLGNALGARLASGPRSRFEATQRAWEAYAVQKCALAAELQRPERAAAMEAGCALREVAIRAIEVERLAARPAERAPNRPMIER